MESHVVYHAPQKVPENNTMRDRAIRTYSFFFFVHFTLHWNGFNWIITAFELVQVSTYSIGSGIFYYYSKSRYI